MYIPHTLKSKILAQWLSGLSRDEIALANGLSQGHVSAILNELRTEVPDLDLMRELAVKLKKENLTILDLGHALRIHNRLNKLNISLELAESIFEKIHIHCFVKRIEVKDFLELVIKHLELLEGLGLPVSEFENFVNKQVDYFWQLDRQCKQITEQRNILARAYKTTVPDLEEFKDLRPIYEKLLYAQDENVKKDKIIADLQRQLDKVYNK
jgi:transcriptional regulator with XRE-family HTH domain